MTKLIDSHCHLYLDNFDPEQDALIREAKDSGIVALLMPNIDLSSAERMHELCDRYPDYAYPMMGLHPTSVAADYAATLRQIESFLNSRSYCAIGEIGIDLYWDKTYLKEQKIVFEEQLKWSIDLDLPVAIHTREAFPEVLDSIYKVGAERLSGVFHSFCGTAEELEEIKKLPRFKTGINGVITFKNAKLADVLRSGTDMQHILLETDAPYLAPVPYRGKRNTPVYIWKTAKKVAETFGLSVEETVEAATRNTAALFRLKKQGNSEAPFM
ncbi:putative deoxyribonuclease YjjV [Bacteroidales bacterium Barb7]|nr:putative deoxyribonuclease YjjV [Bacteroidales bacterium Barb7]